MTRLPANTTLLQRMTRTDDAFSKSDRKLIAIILRDTHRFIREPIGWAADAAGVSLPTVTRLSRKLGCEDFREFRLKLASELGQSTRLPPSRIDSEDNARTVVNKVIQSIEHSINSITDSLETDTLDAASEVLYKANTITLMGLGASGSVAHDARHKFLRVGQVVTAETDIVNLNMLCAASGPGDVILAISYSGQTHAIIDAVQRARNAGSCVISITRHDSSLASLSEIVLNASTADDHDLMAPMTSRIVHLAVIDMLVSLISIRQAAATPADTQYGEGHVQQSEQIQQAILSTRIQQ